MDRAYELVLPDILIPMLDAIALARVDNARRHGRRPFLYNGATTTEHTHRLGVYGEYACCHLYDMPFNAVTDGPDPGHDSVLLGRTVEIKATPRGNRLLVFRRLEHFKADLAILALVDLDARHVEVAGWASRHDFAIRHEIKTLDPKNGPQPVLDRERLRPPETLVPSLTRQPAEGPPGPKAGP